MKDIIERYKKFIEGHDEDWVYDETYRFLGELDRSDACKIMDYLLKQFNSLTINSQEK